MMLDDECGGAGAKDHHRDEQQRSRGQGPHPPYTRYRTVPGTLICLFFRYLSPLEPFVLKTFRCSKHGNCESGMFIPDPESEFFPYRIRIKEF
jgi:hypothetical protein